MSKIQPKIEKSWGNILNDEFQQNYFLKLKSFLLEEKKKYTIYPNGKDIFNAFNLCPFDSIKVVIIGQDPYHGIGQAHGLAFSVQKGVNLPPSLKNIFKELNSDINCNFPVQGDLSYWAKQGVLLLNTVLTVRSKTPGSHQKKGWEIFTNRIIREISHKKKDIVFMLWGNYAKEKTAIIDSAKHHVLTASHPSPLSAYNGFFGCKHFSKANLILEEKNKKPINWHL